MATILLFCDVCSDWHSVGECPEALAENQYRDSSGAVHTLWEDAEGNGHAQIDFTMLR